VDIVGRFFANAAFLERASVRAFRNLRDELARYEAPAFLRIRSDQAAADEQVHTRLTTALARKYGAEPPTVRLGRVSHARPLEDVLDENAREGCVRETLGAAVAWVQSRTARDPAVRRAYAVIARDEIRHAELAWQIASWGRSKLDSRHTAVVRDIYRRELATLRRSAARSVPGRLCLIAGIPTSKAAVAIIDAMDRALFA